MIPLQGQHKVAQLFVNIFKEHFVDTISIEEQLTDMSEKVHKLKNLGYKFKNATITMLIMVSLLDSYASLRQHLYMKDEDTLTMDFVIKQILLKENACEDASHITLMEEGKGKKPVKQSQDSSVDSDAKKKNIKCHYCKRKGYFKSEYKKLKANQAARTVPQTRRVEELKTQTAKVTATSEEDVVCLFIAWESISDLARRWIINLGATSPITSRKEWFINYSPFRTSIPIGLGDDSIIKAVGSESVRISMIVDGKSRLFELQDVYYVPDMGTNNLLSVTYIVWEEYTVNFGERLYEISKARLIIGITENKKGLYVRERSRVA